MGRSPCCDKIGLKKGPWTPEEDQKLLAYIEEHGHGSWRALPAKAGLQRCGKSCRLRWTNYLRPDIKRGKFSLQEEQTIIQLHALLGNRWSAIATHLPKRTDNEIKNYWNTHLKKRLVKMGIDPVTHKPKNDGALHLSADAAHSKTAANLSHMAQWESARLEAEARLVRQSSLRSNSFQVGSGSGSGSSSSQFQKPVGPGRCLDVFKAWNGVERRTAGKSGGEEAAIGVGCGELESSTSTLTSAAGAGDTSAALVEVGQSSCDAEEIGRGWKHLPEFRDGIQLLPSSNSSSEHVPAANFVEKFTDMLLSASSGGRRFPDDGDASDYCEDNKNYWNSILNLVNSSPSDSPLF